MYESDETTVAIKECRNCGVGLIDVSKFCRSCGAAQMSSITPDSQMEIVAGAVEREPLPEYATARLSPQRLYHPVSGPLVTAVAAGVPASTLPTPANSLSRRTLLALMAIPIWVMIILLSPLDAYASAKIIGNRI